MSYCNMKHCRACSRWVAGLRSDSPVTDQHAFRGAYYSPSRVNSPNKLSPKKKKKGSKKQKSDSKRIGEKFDPLCSHCVTKGAPEEDPVLPDYEAALHMCSGNSGNKHLTNVAGSNIFVDKQQ